jgi:large subunit ribosomal protein L25
MKQLELHATRRQVVGKHVNSLRRNGLVPAHVFGRGLDSQSIQIEETVLNNVINKSGKNRILSLLIDGDSEPRNVIVKEIQRDYLGKKVIHVDLYQVRMTEKVRVEIPVVIIGEAPAVKAKLGSLMQAMRFITVECLPADIPRTIEVDISNLVKLDDGVFIKDLKQRDGVHVITDLDELIVKVSAIKITKEEVVKPTEVTAEGAAPVEAEEKGAKAESAAEAGGKAEKPEKPEKSDKTEKATKQ